MSKNRSFHYLFNLGQSFEQYNLRQVKVFFLKKPIHFPTITPSMMLIGDKVKSHKDTDREVGKSPFPIAPSCNNLMPRNVDIKEK